MIWVLAFTIFPLLYSLPRSFQERYRTAESREIQTRWVGLENYRRAWEDREIIHAVYFTSTAVAISITVELVLGLALALAAYRIFQDQTSGWIKAIFTVPMLAAPVAVAYLSLTFFAENSGLINLVLSTFLSEDSLPVWRGEPAWALVAIVLVDCWQWTPFCFLILCASLAAVPDELVEAAEVEGVPHTTIATRILLPNIFPTVVTVLLIRFIEALKIFDVPYVLTRGGPGTETYTYTQWIWRLGLRENQYEMAAALSYMLLIPVLLGAISLVKLTRQ